MVETVSPPGAQHEEFKTWAKARGVRTNGVEPAKFIGRGLGIVARRRIEVLGKLLSLSQLVG